MNTEQRSTLQRTGAYFLAWTAFGVFMFSQAMVQRLFEKDAYPWWHYLISWMVGVYVWFLLTPVVLWLGRRFSFERGQRIRSILMHILFALAIAITQLAVESAVLHQSGVFPAIMSTFGSAFGFLVVLSLHQAFLTYWIILAVQYGFGWYSRYVEGKQAALRLELRSAQLEGQLTQARLSTLKMQLQPHFLFNTLNAIMVLVRQQKSLEAEQMLGRLSDLLRCVLDDVEAQEVPLVRELEYLRLYLSIEQVRFQDRMRVEIDVAPEVFDTLLPQMVLQPIVENAIRHGIGGRSLAGKIRISACRMNDYLEIRVEDDGPGLRHEPTGLNRGIGLSNTRARLLELYGEDGRLSIENNKGQGAVASVILPYRLAARSSETDWIVKDAAHHLAG